MGRKPVRSLIRRYNGKFVPFEKLSNEIKQHLNTRAGELGVLKLERRYGLVQIPLHELIELVRRMLIAYPLCLGGKETTDFQKYHHWYQSKCRTVRGSYDKLWPITLEAEYVESDEYDEYDVFQDGWHRFHTYVDKYHGHKLIPCLFGKSGELVT